MPTSKSRKFRPRLDRLEPICLLSAGVHGPAMVHQYKVVDLKTSTIGHDTAIAIASSTSSFRRNSITLDALTADDTSRTVSGSAQVKYKIGFFGTVTSSIQFTTNLDNPRPNDIKVSISKYGIFVSSKARAKVGTAIASVIRRDHDQIVAAFGAK
ncbi:MAG: hypothetical protein JWN86_1626 [Planctomycetota bacterium]|nr:hypothetical protein [Planctomycetota bacterium]